MSQPHSQDGFDAPKPDNTNASKIDNDQGNTQASKNNMLEPNDTDRIDSPTPPSAQAGHLPSNQPLPITRSTNPSRQSSPEHRSSSVPALGQKDTKSLLLMEKASDMANSQGPESNGHPPPPQEPEPDLGSSKDSLEAYDWDELEQKFHIEMEKCEEVEKGIQGEFDELLEVSMLPCC